MYYGMVGEFMSNYTASHHITKYSLQVVHYTKDC